MMRDAWFTSGRASRKTPGYLEGSQFNLEGEDTI